MPKRTPKPSRAVLRAIKTVTRRRRKSDRRESVQHPAHYGGKDNPYEAIKEIEAWGLNFSLGSAAKYICRAGKKDDDLEDLKKAAKYLELEISRRERERKGGKRK